MILLYKKEIISKKYLGGNKIGKIDTTFMKENLNKTKNFMNANFQTLYFNSKTNVNFLHNNNFIKNEDNNEESSTYRFNNIEDIKVIEIRSREHFGDA